jgi:hypothetical protein
MVIPVSAAPLMALAIVATAPAASARPDPFCDALRQVAAGAAIGFADVRGPIVTPRHTRSLEVYQARVALPEATGCDIAIPHETGQLAPSYVCTFSGGIDVRRSMGRLVRHSARCVRVGVGNPPRLKEGPNGPRSISPVGSSGSTSRRRERLPSPVSGASPSPYPRARTSRAAICVSDGCHPGRRTALTFPLLPPPQ